MASPSKYDSAIYDNSIYEQAVISVTEESDSLDSFSFMSKGGSLSYIEEDDQVISTANLQILGVVDTVENSDTSSIVSNLYIHGKFSQVDVNDSSDISGYLPIDSILIYTSADDVVDSYIVKLPWGSTSGGITSPYTTNTSVPKLPFTQTTGFYGNQRPYEEN